MSVNATVPETTKLMRHANARVTLTTYAGVNEHAAGVAAAKLVAAGFGA
jgi:hypothetical protein